MATKKQIEGWINQVQKRMDEMLEELNMLKDDCERAYDLLQIARDALSELV